MTRPLRFIHPARIARATNGHAIEEIRDRLNRRAEMEAVCDEALKPMRGLVYGLGFGTLAWALLFTAIVGWAA